MSEARIWADVVLNAMEQIRSGVDPRESYQNAARLLGLSESMQLKPCPKAAFLGLCEDGYVNGVAKGVYTRSTKSKSYAVDAAKLLISNPVLGRLNSDHLWSEMAKVNLYESKNPRQHGSQGEMIVVRTLWENGFINK
jgi:folate-dependent tRNA-U54 methylase TrmFO/GidA